MRNTDERVKLALSRANTLKKQEEKKRKYLVMGGSIVCSFVIIFALALTVPSLVEGRFNPETQTALTASMFVDRKTLSYIVIGTLSFLLGIAITLLCQLLKKKSSDTKENSHDN